MKFMINKFLKHAEQDDYNEGCLPGTEFCVDVDITFTGNSPQDVAKQAQEFFCAEDDDVEVNACEEDGRIDVCVMETGEGMRANDHDISLWKKGKKRLWYVIYTSEVERVETVRI